MGMEKYDDSVYGEPNDLATLLITNVIAEHGGKDDYSGGAVAGITFAKRSKLMLPPGVELPSTDEETGLLEISVPCKEFVTKVMEHHNLPGIQDITDSTRLNMIMRAVDMAGVAFSIVTPLDQEKVRFDWLYVLNTERGKGYGKQLWELVLSQFPQAVLIGKIVDTSGRMETLAKKAGAINTQGNKWELRRTSGKA